MSLGSLAIFNEHCPDPYCAVAAHCIMHLRCLLFLASVMTTPRSALSVHFDVLFVELAVVATEQDPWLLVHVIKVAALVTDLSETIVDDLAYSLLESA